MDLPRPSGERERTGPTPPPRADATNPIRLLLVDDKVIMREGVRALLEREPGLHVIAQAATVREALALDVRPDVVITDVVLPDARGNDVVDGLRQHFPRAAIFVLIDRDHVRAEEIVGVHTGGVIGYALKTVTPEEFLSGLRTVAQGVHYLQPSLRAGLAGRDPVSGHEPEPVPASLTGLTEKEREVMHLLALGHTNSEIAALSGVSLRTVEARRARVLQKLGVKTRAELVRIARDLT